MLRGKSLIAGAVIVMLAIAAAFYLYRSSSAPHPKIVAAPQTAQHVPAEITLAGKIQAVKVVDVPTPVDGVIDQFLANVGQAVSEGELLARIHSPKLAAAQQAAQLDAQRTQSLVSELEAALMAARLEVSRSEADAMRTKLELERAEKEYTRQQMLIREGVTPRLVYEKAEQDYTALKAQSQRLADVSKQAAERAASLVQEVESARRAFDQKRSELEETEAELAAGEVNSPVDGVVVARHGQAGEIVTRAVTDLFQIAVDLTALEVVASVEPQVAERIHAGQPAAIEIPGVPGTFPATVREVKSGQVLVDFISSSPTVRPGMAAQVRIKLS